MTALTSDDLPGSQNPATPAPATSQQPAAPITPTSVNNQMSLAQLQAQAQGGNTQVTTGPTTTTTQVIIQQPNISGGGHGSSSSPGASGNAAMSMKDRLALAKQRRQEKYIRFAGSSFGTTIGNLNEDKTSRYLSLVAKLEVVGMDGMTREEISELESLYKAGTEEEEAPPAPEDPYDGMGKENYEFFIDIGGDTPGKFPGYAFILLGGPLVGLALGLFTTWAATNSPWAEPRINEAVEQAKDQWYRSIEMILADAIEQERAGNNKMSPGKKKALFEMYKALRAYSERPGQSGAEKIARHIAIHAMVKDFLAQDRPDGLSPQGQAQLDELNKQVAEANNLRFNKAFAGIMVTDGDVNKYRNEYKSKYSGRRVDLYNEGLDFDYSPGSDKIGGYGKGAAGRGVGALQRQEMLDELFLYGARERIFGNRENIHIDDQRRAVENALEEAEHEIRKQNLKFVSGEDEAVEIANKAREILASKRPPIPQGIAFPPGQNPSPAYNQAWIPPAPEPIPNALPPQHLQAQSPVVHNPVHGQAFIPQAGGGFQINVNPNIGGPLAQAAGRNLNANQDPRPTSPPPTPAAQPHPGLVRSQSELELEAEIAKADAAAAQKRLELKRKLAAPAARRGTAK